MHSEAHATILYYRRSSARPVLVTSATETPRVADVLVKKEDDVSETNGSDQDFMLDDNSDHSDSYTGSLQSPEAEARGDENQNEMLGCCDQLLPWPSASSADFLTAIMDNKPTMGTFIGVAAPAPILPPAPPLVASPSLLACMQQGQLLYHHQQQAAAMVQINHVMLKLKAVQEERLVQLQAERQVLESKVGPFCSYVLGT